MEGFDILGADDATSATAALTKMQANLQQVTAAANAAQSALSPPQQKANTSLFRDAAGATMAPVVGSLIGVAVGGIVGPLLWASHRVAGALIGGLLIGPAVGGGVGYAIAQKKVVDVVATQMEKK